MVIHYNVTMLFSQMVVGDSLRHLVDLGCMLLVSGIIPIVCQIYAMYSIVKKDIIC